LFGGLTATHDGVVQGRWRGWACARSVCRRRTPRRCTWARSFAAGACATRVLYGRRSPEAPARPPGSRRGGPRAALCPAHRWQLRPCRFGMYEAAYRRPCACGFGDLRVLTGQQTGGSRTPRRRSGRETAPLWTGVSSSACCAPCWPRSRQRRRQSDSPVRGGARANQRRRARCRAILARRSGNSAPCGRHCGGFTRCTAASTSTSPDEAEGEDHRRILGADHRGDGSYRLPTWLEAEGAEVLTEPLAAWFDYLFWWAQTTTGDRRGIEPGARRQLRHLQVGHLLYRSLYQFYRSALGFRTAPLDSQHALARLAHGYFNPRIGAGEGHLEVAKHRRAITERRAHMVVSVKPFGCLPSTQSDGVAGQGGSRHAPSIFLAVETSGDGEVNVKSRIQMKLHEPAPWPCTNCRRCCARAGCRSPRSVHTLAVRRAAPAAATLARHRDPAPPPLRTQVLVVGAVRRLCPRSCRQPAVARATKAVIHRWRFHTGDSRP